MFENLAPPPMPITRSWHRREPGERGGREIGVYRRADLVLTLTEDDRRALRRAVRGTVTAVVPSTYPVARDVGAEGMELVHGATAFIADSPEVFAGSIGRLCTDQDLHARLSRNSLEHARARWDPSEVAPRLLGARG
jgi:hypothetical protein